MIPNHDPYQIGGSLPEDAPTYVKRQADDRLYNRLRSGELCYVLNARQMGKSSLLIRTLQRLRSEGFACAAIDLSDLGSQHSSLEQWYGGVAFKLLTSFNLFDVTMFMTWWQQHHLLSPVQRLGELIEQVLLVKMSQPIVIFIDEIDSVLSFRDPLDDFFALIRSCYNKRSTQAEYQRLTFALVGVATPSELIANPSRTPFNVGQAIDLQPFTLAEAQPLALGLGHSGNATAVLAEILDWTGGQPFLTQKLCHLAVAEMGELGTEGQIPQAVVSARLQALVQAHILDHWETQDEPVHLKTIRDRLLCNSRTAGRLLELYQTILRQSSLQIDGSAEQAQLRLSGLVIQRGNTLRVYNRIYATVFNQDWVETAFRSLRPYAEALTAWLASDKQDESRLLRGQALEDALAWDAGKTLSTQDYQFLTASQDAALAEARDRARLSQLEIDRLLREKELLEKLAAEQEQRKLTEAQLRQQRLKQRRWLLSTAGAIGSMLAFLVGVFWVEFSTDDVNVELSRLSQLTTQLVVEGRPEDALTQGLAAGQLLQQSLGINSKTQIQVLLALYQAIYTDANGVMTLPDLPLPLNQPSSPKTAWLALSSDQQWLAIAPSPHAIQVVTLTGEPVVTLSPANLLDLRLLPHQRGLQTLENNGILTTWSLPTSQPADSSKELEIADRVTVPQWPKDQRILARIADDRTLILVNLQGQVQWISWQGRVLQQIQTDLSEITQIYGDRSGQQIALVDTTGLQVQIWNRQGILQGILVHDSPVISLTWTAKGNMLVTLSQGGMLNFWYQDYSLLAQFPGPQSIQGLQFLSHSSDTLELLTLNNSLQVSHWHFRLEDLLKTGCDRLQQMQVNSSSCSFHSFLLPTLPPSPKSPYNFRQGKES